MHDYGAFFYCWFDEGTVIPGLEALWFIETAAEQTRGSKAVSSVPRWFLLQFLPSIPALTPFSDEPEDKFELFSFQIGSGLCLATESKQKQYYFSEITERNDISSQLHKRQMCHHEFNTMWMFLCERWEISGVYAIRYIRRINLIQSSSQNNEASECVFSLLQGWFLRILIACLKFLMEARIIKEKTWSVTPVAD